MVRARGAHLQGTDHDEAVVAALVREVGRLRARDVAPREDLPQKELRHAASGFFGVWVVLNVDHESAQHLVDAIAHLGFKALQVARFEVIGNVVVKRSARRTKSVDDLLTFLHCSRHMLSDHSLRAACTYWEP